MYGILMPMNMATAEQELEVKNGDTHVDFVKLAEVHGLEAVNGRPDVLTVGTLLHYLKLPHARDVRQPRLDLSHVRDLGKPQKSGVKKK